MNKGYIRTRNKDMDAQVTAESDVDDELLRGKEMRYVA